MPTAFELWKAELLIVGNIVQDGNSATPPDEAQRRFQRYCAMLDALTGAEGAQYALAILQSVQAEHDYGAYQTANRAADASGADRGLYCTGRRRWLVRALPGRAGAFVRPVCLRMRAKHNHLYV